jgi:hypothetical protein
MNIYSETNYVLELVLLQEQCRDCEEILRLCEKDQALLVIPAYSLVEPHEKLTRQSSNRKELQRRLDIELRQLARTSDYANRMEDIQDISNILIKSNEEERQRFGDCRERLIKTAEIIPLTSAILESAAYYETLYDLRPQDAIVYASILNHLEMNRPPISCFLNRNTKDFDNPDITDELSQFGCRMIVQFTDGLNFIHSQARSKS